MLCFQLFISVACLQVQVIDRVVSNSSGIKVCLFGNFSVFGLIMNFRLGFFYTCIWP